MYVHHATIMFVSRCCGVVSFNRNDTVSEQLLPNSNVPELGESLAVVVLLWFCACEGVHNTDTFRLSVWALSLFMLESVWKRW